ncbi:alpha/beta hydrolase [Acrocarpospora catenulata]|uniref:alpha/beta hydrolase n=1 Tax=Acrocarpospora catenulata TaxID=2836182 RepID=UPI001BDB68A8|nr:alpha/beta hydrolase-fold protein [Acrocarpospora catenulata]
MWAPRDPEFLRKQLGDADLAVWAEDDVLHVLWRGEARQVELIGGVRPALWRVNGNDDLWEASLRVRGLDEAVIEVVPYVNGQNMMEEACWHGPHAPEPRPLARPLKGTFEHHELDFSGRPRTITLYRPPLGGGLVPAICVADGGSVNGFAYTVEPAILAGAMPPVVLVGIDSDHGDGNRSGPPSYPDPRAREYIPDADPARFAEHLTFVIDEVIPWAEERFPASGHWMTGGYSNGAVWALTAAQRRPDIFTGVAALSPGIPPPAEIHTLGRHYIAAGTLESGFRSAAAEWARRLTVAGNRVRHEEWIGGHDHYWWTQHFPTALEWLLTQP